MISIIFAISLIDIIIINVKIQKPFSYFCL